jgi:hypothetical protein
MKHLRPIIIVGLAAVAIVGCGGSKGSYKPQPVQKVVPASVQAGDEASLFPLAVGNYWVYSLSDVQQKGQQRGSREFELTFKVTSVSDAPDGKKATIDILQKDRTVAETQTWVVNSKGVYQSTSGAKKVPYIPMQPAIFFPVEAGTTTKWSGTGITPMGKPGPMKLSLKNLGPQEVDIEEGRVSAFATTAEGTFTDSGKPGRVVSDGWFAPNIGMVRTRIEAICGDRQVIQLFKLKKYEVK